LDDVPGIVVILVHYLAAFQSPLHQQLRINAARFVSAKTIAERIVEIVEAERVAAARIRPVQKRTVPAEHSHCVLTFRLWLFIGTSASRA
jgi:hypothetical protein